MKANVGMIGFANAVTVPGPTVFLSIFGAYFNVSIPVKTSTASLKTGFENLG